LNLSEEKKDHVAKLIKSFAKYNPKEHTNKCTIGENKMDPTFGS